MRIDITFEGMTVQDVQVVTHPVLFDLGWKYQKHNGDSLNLYGEEWRVV